MSASTLLALIGLFLMALVLASRLADPTHGAGKRLCGWLLGVAAAVLGMAWGAMSLFR